jgi:ABC-type glycerol-3-phosphate transport system substrate-binding protein
MNALSLRRREFLQMTATTLGATALGGALAACGATPATTSGSTVTLTYWDYMVSQAPWVDNEIKLFQEAHPNIRIKKTTQVYDQYANLFSLAAKSKKLPDVAMLPDTPDTPEQVHSGWWLPVDKWAKADWQARFPAGTFHDGAGMFDGKIYSAPLTGPWYVQLYINNSVFKQAGLTNSDGTVRLPQTWDDVTHAAEAITKKSGGSSYGLGFGNGSFGLLNWWLRVFTLGAGAVSGDGPDYRTGKWTFGSNRNYQDFIEVLLEWKKKGYMYPNSMSASDEAARAAFSRGQIGMTVGGVWNQPTWTASKFTDYSLVALVPPSQPLQGYWYKTLGGQWFAITSQTKHPDEAWAWFDWLYSPAAGKRWVQMGEDLSAFPEANDPALVKFQPFAQYVAGSKFCITGPDPTIRNPQTAKVEMAAIAQDIDSVLAGAYTGQIRNLHTALTETEDRYNKALEEGIAEAVKQGAKVSINDYIFPDWDPTKPYTTKPNG